MPFSFDVIAAACGGLGFSAAAGLNAYIPLVVVAIMQERGVVHLAEPFDGVGRAWVIVILVALLGAEIVLDKIPRVDRINDLVHTLIRPAAGGFLFAASMALVAGEHLFAWAGAGVAVAALVHVGKMMSRPVIHYGSPGVGTPVVSLVEDLVAMVLTVMALMVPVMTPVLVGLFGWILVKLFRRQYGGWRKERRVYRVVAIPIKTAQAVKVKAVAVSQEESGVEAR